MTVGKIAADPANRIFLIDDAIRLVNIAFAYTFTEAKLSTTGRQDMEHIKNVGQDSTIMRLLSKDGYLISYLEENGQTEAEIKFSS